MKKHKADSEAEATDASLKKHKTDSKDDSGDDSDSFEIKEDSLENRLKVLRFAMKDNSIDALIIPTADAHQSEYVAECDKRRAWISGFDGSAGTALVMAEKAFLWTDGRYFSQAEKQLSSDWKLMKSGTRGVPELEEFLATELKEGQVAACAADTVSAREVEEYSAVLTGKGKGTFALLSSNIVDLVWEQFGSRPPRPSNPVFLLEVQYAGMSVHDKLALLRSDLKKKECDYLIVSALDEIACMFFCFCSAFALRVGISLVFSFFSLLFYFCLVPFPLSPLSPPPPPPPPSSSPTLLRRISSYLQHPTPTRTPPFNT